MPSGMFHPVHGSTLASSRACAASRRSAAPCARARVALAAARLAQRSSRSSPQLHVASVALAPRRGTVAPPPSPRPTARARAASEPGAADAEPGEIGIFEVEELRGIRANLDGQEPVVEYRVHWKDGSADTWELASNLSPDLVRDFDERWWAAAKRGDVEVIGAMLKYGRTILSQVVDENRRSALHFAAAIGNVKAVQLLADAGADLDLQDKEGYTPLHMACGYMQTAAMTALLEAGADPLVKDKQGRDVVLLVDNLRRTMPPSMAALQRIMALEQVASGLTDRLYEEVEPAAILDERPAAGGSGREYLVQYKDDTPDEWLPEAMLAPDLVQDWAGGLERAPVAALLDVQQWGTSRDYLVAWGDGSPDSWEAEDNIPPELVAELQEAQPELFRGLKGVKGKKKSKGSKKKQKSQQLLQQQQLEPQQQQQQPAAAGADGAGEQQRQQSPQPSSDAAGNGSSHAAEASAAGSSNGSNGSGSSCSREGSGHVAAAAAVGGSSERAREPVPAS